MIVNYPHLTLIGIFRSILCEWDYWSKIWYYFWIYEVSFSFFHIWSSVSPLVLQSWIELTAVDIQKRICEVFQFSFTDEEEDILDEIEYEIDASFETVAVLEYTPREIFDTNFSPVPVRSTFSERMRTNSFDTPRLRTRTNSISRANSIIRHNSIDNVSADLLTPLRKRIETQVVEQKLLKKYNLKASMSKVYLYLIAISYSKYSWLTDNVGEQNLQLHLYWKANS